MQTFSRHIDRTTRPASVVPGEPQGAVVTPTVEEDRGVRHPSMMLPRSRICHRVPPRPHRQTSRLDAVPELPEVEALALDLGGRLDGHAIKTVFVAQFSALKTFDPPLRALEGGVVEGVTRHGKFLDIIVAPSGGLHLVMHLARGGWVRWKDEVPTLPPKPSGRNPLAAAGRARRPVRPRHHRGRHQEEPGDLRRPRPAGRARHRQPRSRPAHRRLHPRGLPRHRDGRGSQADQGRAAPPGHDRRHRQRLLRRDPARRADVAVQAGRQPRRGRRRRATSSILYDAIRVTLGDAVDRSRGLAASELKGEKKSNLAVHGRTGEKCPVCGDTVREVSFADSSLQYCATCQTGGKPLADRRMSKLLK